MVAWEGCQTHTNPRVPDSTNPLRPTIDHSLRQSYQNHHDSAIRACPLFRRVHGRVPLNGGQAPSRQGRFRDSRLDSGSEPVPLFNSHGGTKRAIC